MMKTLYRFVLLCAITGFLAACAANVSPNVYNGANVGVASRVVPAVVVAKRAVTIDNNSGAGGVAGLAGGAAAGSAIGGSPQGAIVGAVGGAVLGGVVGNAIDKRVNRHRGYEYILKMKKGQLVSVTQEKDLALRIGQHVLVVYGAMTRIIPDNRHQQSKA